MRTVALLFSLILPVSMFAQAELIPTKQVGPKSYPPAARAVRASGEVVIEITIDPDGNVINSKATLGHPLLRAVSEQTVRFWKYEKVAKDSASRTEKIYLDYSLDYEVKLVPESEMPSDFGAETIFSGPTHGTVKTVEFIPRLWRLPRKNGEIEPRFCSLHKDELSVETHSYNCSALPEDFLEEPEGYDDARSELFPFAYPFGGRGCSDAGIELKESLYCSNCRIARNNWLQINSK